METCDKCEEKTTSFIASLNDELKNLCEDCYLIEKECEHFYRDASATDYCVDCGKKLTK